MIIENQPLLQYYTDGTWGYAALGDRIKKSDEGIKVKFQQEEDETREDFFTRLGFEPKPKMYGFDLWKDKKVRSIDFGVRRAVATQGYGLDILVNDESPIVREEVARQGYGLDILVNDENRYVREIVAEQGYGLDFLIHDEAFEVRMRLAEHGYGLDVLVHDASRSVRYAVRRYLKKCGYPSLETWIEYNPQKCADRKNRK